MGYHGASMEIFRRPVLFVCRPAHELKLLGWLARWRPEVQVLTDGSGSRGLARLCGTERTLAVTNCRAGTIFGRLTDRALYALLLERRAAPFVELAEKLAERIGRRCAA